MNKIIRFLFKMDTKIIRNGEHKNLECLSFEEKKKPNRFLFSWSRFFLLSIISNKNDVWVTVSAKKRAFSMKPSLMNGS